MLVCAFDNGFQQCEVMGALAHGWALHRPRMSLGMGWGQGPVRAQPDPPVVSSSEGGAGFAEPGELSAAHLTTGFSNTERVKRSTAARRG